VYAFQPGEDAASSITVHVMEAADSTPTLMKNCAASAGKRVAVRAVCNFNDRQCWVSRHAAACALGLKYLRNTA
jgi:hypothetical protein